VRSIVEPGYRTGLNQAPWRVSDPLVQERTESEPFSNIAIVADGDRMMAAGVSSTRTSIVFAIQVRRCVSPLMARSSSLGTGRAAQTLLLSLRFFVIVLTLHLMLKGLAFLLTARDLTKESATLAQAASALAVR
jgi:hypothetical protein